MLAFDTNLAVYAANLRDPRCADARAFLEELRTNRNVAICDLMLVELYLKLCNSRIFANPWTPAEASKICLSYRENRAWKLIEGVFGMPAVWEKAASPNFAFRRIIDARLALTLRHQGVTEFATHNVKDFQDFGFKRVWNPLESA